MDYISRLLDLPSKMQLKSHFLLGPRQSGKTALIGQTLSADYHFDLLESDTYLQLSQKPHLLREYILKDNALVVIDEIQKIPELLNEVHLLIEKKQARFLLTGSSASKIRRAGVNLLGGRARHCYLHPLTYAELSGHSKTSWDLNKALSVGCLPSIYLSDRPKQDLKSYIGDYIKEEIAYEGLSRNIPAFGRFLQIAGLCYGQLLNFSNIANDAQVARTTVYEYFDILKDTLIAHELKAWKKGHKRKPLVSSKLYFFDVGVGRHIAGFGSGDPQASEYGRAFEAYIFQELLAYTSYKEELDLRFWRSNSGFEVDFIVNNSIAIEVKSSNNIQAKDLKGLRALDDENTFAKKYIVCQEKRERMVGDIHILPIEMFLQRLWKAELFGQLQ